MTALLETLLKEGRRIGSVGEADEGPQSVLYERQDGQRRLVWRGPRSWVEDIEQLWSVARLDGLEAVPRLSAGPSREPPALVMEIEAEDVEPFDIWTWRNLDHSACVQALRDLARVVRRIQGAGWALGGLERSQLLFDPDRRRLIVGAVPGLKVDDGERETMWRDIRLFGELAYENFLDHEYPGGHELVSLLQDREAMAETGLKVPGLTQLLAGCVTPYGDLAYRDVDGLLEGLEHLADELATTFRVRVGARSTQGAHIFRQNNQDSCGHVLVDTTVGSRATQMGFFCVADGIGGIEDGQRASSLAVDAACTAFWRAWRHYDAQDIRRRPGAFARSIAQVTSQRLALEGDFAPDQNRGGTTFTGLLLAGGRVGLCHVGDSRAMLIRDSRSILLTRDHTLASILQRLEESGEADREPDDASNRTLARFFSTGTELEYRRIEGIAERAGDELGLSELQRRRQGFRVRSGDVFLLTTDGAHDEIEASRFRRLLALEAQRPGELCDAIVEEAVENIGRDNATALAVFVE